LATCVHGDPAAIHAAATGLAVVGGGIDDAVTGFTAAVGASESIWAGPAATGFRARVNSARAATAEIGDEVRKVTSAMHTFADQLRAVKALVEHAKAIAAGAGLRVGGDAIQPPKPPPPPPAVCLTPAAAVTVARQYAAAQVKFRAQLAAYQQAEQILRQARTAEQHAHQELNEQLSQAQGVLSELSTSDRLAIAGVYGAAVTDAARKAENLIQEAESLGQRQQWFTRLANDPGFTPTEQRYYRAKAGRLGVEQAEALDEADANEGLARGLSLGGDSSAPAVRYLGPGMAAAAAAFDIVDAPNAVEAVHRGAADGAGYGAAVATSAALDSAGAFAAIGVGGAPATLGTSLIAAGVGYAVTQFINDPGGTVRWFEGAGSTLAGAASSAAGTVAHAITHNPVADAISDVFS
jgi:hypothetical protein